MGWIILQHTTNGEQFVAHITAPGRARWTSDHTNAARMTKDAATDAASKIAERLQSNNVWIGSDLGELISI